jgi:hypothetical protein
MKRSGLVVDGEALVDKLGLQLEYLLYVGDVLLLNVPVEVFVVGVGVGDALDQSHFYNYLIMQR